ncbi:MAG: radical SAM protein [Methanomicrobiales archaeon]|nr:radical SAM protein [Methanomicrobiales archaeon]
MSSDGIILDGYIDEPACLGVPPYISPFVRYAAGVLREHRLEPRYFTIDQLRQDPSLLRLFRDAKVLVMVAGTTVPGKYLGGRPATLTEIQQTGSQLKGPLKILGGPVVFGYAGEGGRVALRRSISGFDAVLKGPFAESLDALLSGGEPVAEPDYHSVDRWSVLGSIIVRQHPSFPHVMCELETATGCPRTLRGGCSFCTERFYGPPRYRSAAGIVSEVKALYTRGALYFRLGRQPDILVYGTGADEEFPEPSPENLEELFRGIRKAAPHLKTLHIDNVSPATIARHPEAAMEALRAIVRHHTAGDVAAIGMETADPAVVRANNLKAMPEEVMDAIHIINQVGAAREGGIPHLLPGLNFVSGLAGETSDTYRLNMEFLREVQRRGWLVRRVNIRQLMLFEDTPAFLDNTLGRYRREFQRFKEMVRREFDLPMLRRVFPVGTLLREVVIEEAGEVSFGRQLGSYPILVGVPLELRRGEVIDVVVVDHGMRSITALPVPVRVNRLPVSALPWIPNVGRRKAGSIAAVRPFSGLEAFRAVAGVTPIDGFISFD